jgi:CDP-paratose 2-epimerase
MKIIITGGAGFIGCNAASRYLRGQHRVVIIDNLSRPGAAKNLEWLKTQGPVELAEIDISDERRVLDIFKQHSDADRILHLAGQVAVTTSVKNPRLDFYDNAVGAFNVLEGIRAADMPAPLIYASTNKVYGEMTEVGVVEKDNRYTYAGLPYGVPESQNLDFHSPYGCSKGAADQYVIDYHRIYGLRTTVFRQSCIYGYRQFGMEDQGWIAWFMIAAKLGRSITLYGDGKQVRDVLFIEDLLDAYDAAFAAPDKAAGRAYNVGGGPENVLSLLELLAYVQSRQEAKLPYSFSDWRPGDQKVFVSDIRRAASELGWKPKVSVRQGLELLYNWISANGELFREVAVTR